MRRSATHRSLPSFKLSIIYVSYFVYLSRRFLIIFIFESNMFSNELSPARHDLEAKAPRLSNLNFLYDFRLRRRRFWKTTSRKGAKRAERRVKADGIFIIFLLVRPSYLSRLQIFFKKQRVRGENLLSDYPEINWTKLLKRMKFLYFRSCHLH